MARLMSQIKGGYYAAAPEFVAAVMERLTRGISTLRREKEEDVQAS